MDDSTMLVIYAVVFAVLLAALISRRRKNKLLH
jgi:LPXTG-motif cell wall-anchored protein